MILQRSLWKFGQNEAKPSLAAIHTHCLKGKYPPIVWHSLSAIVLVVVETSWHSSHWPTVCSGELKLIVVALLDRVLVSCSDGTGELNPTVEVSFSRLFSSSKLMTTLGTLVYHYISSGVLK